MQQTMEGSLRIILNIILFFSYQLGKSHGQFNLYDTEETSMIDSFGYHCLYVNSIIDPYGNPPKAVAFCIRPETVKISNDENKSCYGTKITFNQLKLLNVSTDDLLNWNAVIEIIDLYAKYLLLPNLINDNEFYCNCSFASQFGKFCEYIFNEYDPNNYFKRRFTELYSINRLPSYKEHRNQFMTYYIGISCQSNFDYLDWRQICNGIVDCDNGEDEPFELCLQMELNQCNNQTEFRCQNGLCIPISLMDDTDDDCSDQTDLKYYLKHKFNSGHLSRCFLFIDFGCAEINLGWKKFSCGHSQFISYKNLMSKVDGKADKNDETCHNKGHLKYLNKLFYSKNQDGCWKTMICLTGFNYLFPNVTCLNDKIENNIKNFCPNEFYFPPNSIVYSFVYFQYEKFNRKDWFNYTGPNYICYKKEYCQKKNITFGPTILKNDLTCFHVNQTIFSWMNFYEYIIHLFSQCYLNFSTSIIMNNKLLYKCNLSDTYVSIHRLKDRVNDCFFNEDENLNLNLCSFNTNDEFRCLTNQNECIRESFIRDEQFDCTDGSDEYFVYMPDICSTDESCRMYVRHLRKEGKYHLITYQFRQLCDTSVNRYLFSIESNETDETDCDYWPFKFTCNSPFTKCNQIWNCPNGIDEINCPNIMFYSDIRKKFNCSENESYCIQFINNNTDINLTCINLNRNGDGIMDCIGGTDERLTNICTQLYPIDFTKRFHCMNSSVCIKPNQVCDRIIDCPYEDDERVCPWLFKSNASKFDCFNSSSESVSRCGIDGDYSKICPLKENVWFCDLALKPFMLINSGTIQFEPYPKLNQQIQSFSFKNVHSNQLLLAEQKKVSLTNTNNNSMWLCNEGYPIRLFISNTKSYCLCPPTYYGDYCQYQSEHLTVIIKLQLKYEINRSTIFRFIIYLINENNQIISHDEIVTDSPLLDDYDPKKFSVHLIDERMINRSLYERFKSKFVRIDSYIISQTNVKYISSWLYNVSFSFLPVNRLVTLILLEDEPHQRYNCKKKCGPHGKCMYYINSTSIQYCWCDQGWFGEQCHLKSSSNLCNQTSCAPYAQCMIINDKKQEIKCICPLGKFGKQCYIKYDSCFNIQCVKNKACSPLDQRIFSRACICMDCYNGNHHQYADKPRNIFIPANISTLPSIPAVLTISSHSSVNYLPPHRRRIFKDVSLPINLEADVSWAFEFVRIFYNKSTSYYYMTAIEYGEHRQLDLTTVISKNLCPNISEIFNKTILNEYSYLKRMKLYHIPCQQNKELRCFYDKYRMCLCTKDHYSDCYVYDHESVICDSCKNDGLCLKRSPGIDQSNVFCICPKCSLGDFCQLTTGNYYINLDMLVGTELKSDHVSFDQQSFIIHLTLIILIIILILSLIFNIISIIIFSNIKNQQVGCDLYLLSLTIISQIGLILLFLRYLYTIFSQIYIIENILLNKISCITLEYSTRLIPSLFDWLTVCISMERAYTVIKDVHFTKVLALKTLKLSRSIISIVILFNILTTLYRPFYLVLIDVPTLKSEISDHSWCVLDLKQTRWNTYEKFINIIHLIIPFILNLLSIILFLLFKVKSESGISITTGQKSTFVILKGQIIKYKPLIISTMIIIILETPRFLFTFILACIEYPWQRYIYLTGYLISFLPLMSIFFIYIIPSPKYKKEYQRIMKKGFCKYFCRFNDSV